MRPLKHIAFILFCLTCSGHSAIYYSGIRDIPIPANSDGILIRLADGSISLSPSTEPDTTPWINLFFSGTGIASSTYLRPVITAPASGNGDGLVLKKVTMQEIGTLDQYASGPNGSENHTGSGAGQFQTGTPGHLGFSMRSVSNGPVRYGWMRITINDTGGGVVHDWAYQLTTGDSILAGAVPEPSAVWLAAMTTGVLLSRRRRMREVAR